MNKYMQVGAIGPTTARGATKLDFYTCNVALRAFVGQIAQPTFNNPEYKFSFFYAIVMLTTPMNIGWYAKTH